MRTGSGPQVDSAVVRAHYTAEYYLQDCGGWQTFALHGARQVGDARLQSLLDLALQTRPKRLLDLGCGRGEITFQAARRGIAVTAVDYSPAAIEIARKCFQDDPDLARRVTWICGSAAELNLEGEYDVVVAGDLVEHMSAAELERMYASVRRHLSPAGRFIVHTYPNVWYYRYDYPRRRRLAEIAGENLPVDPRSHYEKLMHVNEQNPRELRRQLARHFPHVLLWFLHPEEPAGSLARPMDRRELAASRDLYAVASLEPVSAGSILPVLAMPPLTSAQTAAVSWTALDVPRSAIAGSEFALPLRVKNCSDVPIHSRPPCPVHLSYHWRSADVSASSIFEGGRTAIGPALQPGDIDTFQVAVSSPATPGKYLLEPTLVQENVHWFEQNQPGPLASWPVEVTVN